MSDYDFMQAMYYATSIGASITVMICLPAIRHLYTEVKGLREDLRKRERGLAEKLKKE